MKKKLISVLLTLAVAGTMLAGCGSSKQMTQRVRLTAAQRKKISQSEFVLIW